MARLIFASATRRLAIAVAAGVLITLVTGLIPTRTLLGATQYGFPLPWLIRRTVAPESSPWHVAWVGLVVDVAVHSAVLYGLFVLYERA